MIDFLSNYTVRTVALAATLLGISSGVLGSFAVLRKQSLLGDALSHAALPGLAIAFLLTGNCAPSAMLPAALLSGALASLLLLLIVGQSRLKSDAALGIILSTFFAFGLVLMSFISKSNNVNQGCIRSFLFGQVAATTMQDVRLMFFITITALTLIAMFWKEFKLMSFDKDYAASLGLPIVMLDILMTSMVALAIVVGLKLVGVVLMAAMLIAPAVAARQWSKNLEQMLLLAALFGVISGLSGTILSSSYRGLATGPLIVISASLILIASLLFAPERGLVSEWQQARRNKQNLKRKRVLLDLYSLAKSHNDPNYLSEAGMLQSYYGLNPNYSMQKLLTEGLVERQKHMSEEGWHYRLSSKGYQEAQKAWQDLGAQATAEKKGYQ